MAADKTRVAMPDARGDATRRLEIVVNSGPQQLLIDPSILFSERAVALLQEDASARENVVVSEALWQAIMKPGADFSALVSPDDLRAYPGRRQEALVRLVEGLARFSYASEKLAPESDQVRARLLDLGGLAGPVFADEWAFLQSHSWMVAHLRHPLDAFRDAGAAVVEFGQRLRDTMIRTVAPAAQMPPVTVPFIARVGVKWVVVGGAAGAAILSPPLFLAGLLAIPFVQAFDA
jgi:hypothetical protein